MVHACFALFRREFYIYVSDLFLREKITYDLFVLCCLCFFATCGLTGLWVSGYPPL